MQREITPNNMLHPGYRGALAADVSVGQTEIDPVYPESRTRRQLLEQWLPGAFLNPTAIPRTNGCSRFPVLGMGTNRQGANNGRTWWIPARRFTSLTYLRDDTHPYSQIIRIARASWDGTGCSCLLGLEDRMNAISGSDSAGSRRIRSRS